MKIWNYFPGYDSLYALSNEGDVRRAYKNGKVKTISPFLNNSGYPSVSLYKNRKRKSFCIHRALAILFIPNPENLLEVNHKDGDKTNYSLNNLEWISHSGNIQHSYDNGLQRLPVGELNSASKLTEKQVLEIRALGKGNTLFLMKKYNVGRTTIKNIISRKTWKHV